MTEFLETVNMWKVTARNLFFGKGIFFSIVFSRSIIPQRILE
jgi:hypothetical protein